MLSGVQIPRRGRSIPRNAARSPLGWLICLLLLGLHGGSPAASQKPQASPVRYLGHSFGSRLPFAAADLDGDNRPDLAHVETGARVADGVNYQIQLQLSSTVNHAIQVTGPLGGLAIEARDVNGDNAVDLVVSSAYFGRPVAVFLNDGHGSFSQAAPGAFPAAFSSAGAFQPLVSTDLSGAEGLPPQPRLWIGAQARNLSDARPCAGRVSAARLNFVRNSLSRFHSGRAPPSESLLS